MMTKAKRPQKPKFEITNQDAWDIQTIARHLSWAYNHIEHNPPESDHSYDLGARETIGHLLSCWLVQEMGYPEFDTAEATSLLFDGLAKLKKEKLPDNQSKFARIIATFIRKHPPW